eukprot:gene31588-38176_t
MLSYIDLGEVVELGAKSQDEEIEPPHFSPEEYQSPSADIERGVSGANDSSSTLVNHWRPENPSLSPLNVQLGAASYSPRTPANAPAVLSFSGIVVKTRHKPKKILLDNVSGSITGGFWAIMGASGGGKTTLLSTLSLRLDTNYMEIHGEFRLNGREYSRHMLKAMSAYVMQDDLLHGELTVQETLLFCAALRMPFHTPRCEREERVSELLAMLEISGSRDVIIGDSRRKGVSGGERKRVSVAIELLNKPKLLFLDEPTTGLDSNTAFSLAKMLKHLGDVGECTVVCTIHQPMPKIFQLFDNLILMKQGKIVYLGNAFKVVLFLWHAGLPCPPNVDLADHLLDTVCKSKAHIDTSMVYTAVNLDLGIEKPEYRTMRSRLWIYECFVLTKRNLLLYARRRRIIVINFVATAVIAVFVGFSFWFQIGKGQASIRTRTPSLFFAMVNQGVVGSLQAVTSFPAERAIMLRERAAGAYQTSAYFTAKAAVDAITLLWPPILFASIVYYAVGYQNNVRNFFIYMMFTIFDTYAAASLSTLVVCTCVSIERSTVVLTFLFEITRLYGGYYTSPAQLDANPSWRFVDALSYIKYAYIGIALNELEHLQLSCDPTEKCKYTTGSQQIATL